jgi:hypothetical protein
VADVFEALTKPRKHRKAFTPFESMETVIKMSQRGLLSSFFVKSLLKHSALFPVGSIVELSDHRLARVVHANPAVFHRPQVSVLCTEDKKLLDEDEIYPLDLSIDETVTIIRALPSDLIRGMDGMNGF